LKTSGSLSVKDEILSAKVAKIADIAQAYDTKSVFHGSFCYFYDKTGLKTSPFQKEFGVWLKLQADFE
jgi:hypothetical protein